MPHFSLKKHSLENPDTLFIFTIGGCGEFGMNMTAYAYKGRIIVVDCGLVFSEPYEIGVDSHVPSLEVLESIFDGTPDAFFITHGHEDHLGALPHFLPRWNIPVYLGRWALELLKEKLLQRQDYFNYTFHEIKPGSKSQLSEDFTVDWLHVPHSIPDCCSLLITAGKERVFHTGDFKSKGYSPFEADIDLASIESHLKNGPISAIVSDSTNSLSPGYCPSETETYEPLRDLIATAHGTTFVTTFSSNLWRIKTVLLVSKQLKKKVFVLGTGMRKALELGIRLKLLEDETSVLIDDHKISKIPRNELTVLISGCQGEYRSGMHRLVNNEIGSLSIKEGDQFIFSSRSIPGNEKNIAKIISKCHFNKATVHTSKDKPGIHVSGHAHSEDLRSLIKVLNPKFYIPVHGTFTQLAGNQSLLADSSKVIPVANGSVIGLSGHSWKSEHNFDLERLYVDSWSRQLMSYDTMRARHKIGDSGLTFASGFIGQESFSLDIECVGLPFQSDHDEKKFKAFLSTKIQDLYNKSFQDSGFSKEKFNEQVRQLIRKNLSERFIKKPVVFSKIFIQGNI